MRLKFNNKHETINNKQSFSVNRRKTVKFLACSKSLFKVYSLKFKAGQSLIEVLVAFAVSVMIGVALINAGLATQKSSISARNESQATKLAQEYLEEVRAFRDKKGFTDAGGGDNLPDGCYKIVKNSSTEPPNWNLTSIGCPANNGTAEDVTVDNKSPMHFYRSLMITTLSANISKKVIVEVDWQEGVNNRKVTAETVLTKWCEGNVDGNTSNPACH